jgi:TIR domain
MPAARKRFFISYSRADKDLVEPVVTLLRTAPTDVFFDIDSIQPGDIWTNRLERAIKGASSFVIFWCDHSANSPWVRKE